MIDVQFFHGSFYGTWAAKENALCYIIRVTDGSVLLAEKRILSHDFDSQKDILLYTPETLFENKEYHFYLETVTEYTECTTKIPLWTAQLEELRHRILSHSVAGCGYLLNAETMADESLAVLMKEYLGYDELTIWQPKEPILSSKERSLYLEGRNVSVVLFLDDRQMLQITLLFFPTTLTPSQNTDLEEHLNITNAKLCFTSYSHNTKENIKLERGLNFLGEITLPIELNGVVDSKIQKQCIAFSGSICQHKNEICFEGKNNLPLPSFFVMDLDKHKYELKHSTLFITVKVSIADDKGFNSYNIISAFLEGSILQNETECTMRILLPVIFNAHVVYSDPQLVFPTIVHALSYIEGSSDQYPLPKDFQDLSSVIVKSAGFVLTPKYGHDMYYLKIGSDSSPFSLLPQKLELTNWNLMLRRFEYRQVPQKITDYAASLTGEFLIAEEKKIELSASVSGTFEWTIHLECMDGNWLKALANLIGFSADVFSDRLSFLWKGAEKMSFQHAWFTYDAKISKITSMNFCISMNEPWELLPFALTLEQVQIYVVLTHHSQWEYNLSLNGAVKIGNGDKAAEIFVSLPIGQEMSFLTFSTREKGIALPSFEDLLAVVGIENASAYIPEDFRKSAALKISKWEVTIGLNPKQYLESFTFGVASSQIYNLFLGSLTFSIQKLEIQMDYQKDTPIVFSGKGQFSLFDIEMDVQIRFSEHQKPILSAEVSKENANKIMFQKMVDTFTDTPKDQYVDLPIPEHFREPVFEKANVYIDIEKELYLMYGQVLSLGSSFFVSTKQETKWGYLFAAALDSNFTFSMISQSLAILDSYLHIQKAGILISSLHDYHLSDITAVISSKASDTKSVIPAELPSYNGKLHKGVFIYGTIAFTAPVFSNLIRLGSNIGELQLETYAYLPKKEDTTELFAKVNEFLLFGIFQFKELTLCYHIQKEKQFDLNGTLSIVIGKQSFDFKGTMQICESQSTFSVQTEQNILEPIGLSGLELRNIALQLNMRFPKDFAKTPEYELTISGSVKIGSVLLKGELLFQKQSISVYCITLGVPIAVNKLFAAIFTTNVWSSDSLEISVDEGILYKAEETCRIGVNNYQKGFHLRSKLTIYNFSFVVEGRFDQNAFEISGIAQKEVSLGFLTITGTQGTSGCGIKFKANNTEKILGFTGGIKLFGERIADIDLFGYDMEQHCFKGTVQYGGDLELFKGAKISFTWSKEKGIQIQEFPMKFIDQTLDFTKLLRDASKLEKDSCGELVGLGFKNAVTTKFEITPSFRNLTDNGLVIELIPKYRIFILEQEITKAVMKKISVTVPTPNTYGLGALANLIVTTVTNNALDIAKQLLSDQEGMMRFITTIGVVNGTELALRALICYGRKELTEGLRKVSQALQYTEQVQQIVIKGALLAEVAAAAAAAAAAAESAKKDCDTTSKYFAALFAGLLVSGGTSPVLLDMKEHQEYAEQKAEKVVLAKESARSSVQSMLAIQDLKMEETSVGSLLVSWGSIPSGDLNVSYHIITEQNGVASSEIIQDKTQLEISYDPASETLISASVYASFAYPENGQDYIYRGESSHSAKTVGMSLELCIDRLPDAKSGESYHFVIPAQGGILPYHYDVQGLPYGLFVSDGIITGMPQIGGGEVWIDITITDAMQKSVKKGFWLAIR